MATHRILVITTSHATLGTTGKPTGLWLEELAVPYWAFRDAGYEVDIVSMAGGKVPLDPRSVDEGSGRSGAVQRFLNDAHLIEHMNAAPALASVAPEDYDAIFLPGGHGTMWDLPADENLARAIAKAYDEGRIVSAVCHGPAGLVGALRADGKALVGARRVTAFTNAEEAAAGLTDTVPFLLESRLRELGAIFESAQPFKSFVVRDGNLITGQNPQSSQAVADAVLEALSQTQPGDPAVRARESGISSDAPQGTKPAPVSSSSNAS
jgi:putative intracellular protease/amidase